MEKALELIEFFRYYVGPTAILLGILIFVHEFGHFIVAKCAGVRILKFSLGFGPKIIGRKIGDTEYLLSALPLGGYVKPLGESPDEPISEEEKQFSLSHQGIGKRFAIIVAGSLFNIIFACLLFTIIFMLGTPMLLPKVGKVMEDSPAQSAGLQEGDTIVAINGKRIEFWDELSQVVESSGGKTMTLLIRRDDKVITVTLVPQILSSKDIFGQETKSYKIGIVASTTQDAIMEKRYNPAAALLKGVYQTWNISRLTFLSIIKIIQRTLPAETIGGPIRIAEIAGEFAEAGIISFFSLMAVISVNLGVLNLLPVPILDGGHIFFLIVEAIKGKPLSMKKLEIAQQIGFAILIIVMVFVFYNDIARIING